jgi:hypothetical protein
MLVSRCRSLLFFHKRWLITSYSSHPRPPTPLPPQLRHTPCQQQHQQITLRAAVRALHFLAYDLHPTADLLHHKASGRSALAVRLGSCPRPGVLGRDPETAILWYRLAYQVCLVGKRFPGVRVLRLWQRREQDVRERLACGWAWQVLALLAG